MDTFFELDVQDLGAATGGWDSSEEATKTLVPSRPSILVVPIRVILLRCSVVYRMLHSLADLTNRRLYSSSRQPQCLDLNGGSTTFGSMSRAGA